MKHPTPDLKIIGVPNLKFQFSYKIESNKDQDH